MCALRLAHEHRDTRSNVNANLRYRVRNQIVEQARVAHAELQAPRLDHFDPLPGLFPEERSLFDRAAATYVALFRDAPARTVDLDGWETVDDRRGIRLLGGVDLVLESDDGSLEARMLRFDRDSPAGEILDDPGMRLAALRVAPLAEDRRLVLREADLLRTWRRDASVDLAAVQPELEAWLDERIRIVRERAVDPVPRPGLACGWCRFVAHCGAHR